MHIATHEKYRLYTLRTNKKDDTMYWEFTREYPNKTSMIEDLSYAVNTHGYDDSSRWTCKYFDEINVTESDTYMWDTLTWFTTPHGVRFPRVNVHHGLRPYHFETDSGASVDIRNFKDEIFARVHARRANLLPKETYSYKPYHRRYPKSHHCTHYHGKSHFYSRLRNTHVEEYEDDNIHVKFKPKAKDLEAKWKWYDDFWGHGECGWKTHKHKHQWEHKIYKKK